MHESTPVPHIRVVKPMKNLGKLTTGRLTKFYITLPGHEEIEVPMMRSARLDTRYDDVDLVTIEMIASIEILYADEEG